MKTGVEKISQERAEHFVKHGLTIQHDVDTYKDGQLLQAAIVLLISADQPEYPMAADSSIEGMNLDTWNKMIAKNPDDKLVIAGALIAAEIDRRQALIN